MLDPSPTSRVFLFLQGPHGPFFHQLARMLRAAGSAVWLAGADFAERPYSEASVVEDAKEHDSTVLVLPSSSVRRGLPPLALPGPRASSLIRTVQTTQPSYSSDWIWLFRLVRSTSVISWTAIRLALA